MSLPRLSIFLLPLFTACVDSGLADLDEPSTADDGKADGASTAVDVEWCKEAAGNYARRIYNDFEGAEILETTKATVLQTGSGFLWIQTDSEGHGSKSTDVILTSSACYAIGSKYAIGDRADAVFFARKAAYATRAYVEKTWDFGAILSAELRWPVTSDGVTVDVRLLDGGHDEGAFAVTLSHAGKVKKLEQTEHFTP